MTRGGDAPAAARGELRGHAWVVTLDRPERHNAIDEPTAARIASAALGVADHPGARAIVVTGAGGYFAAGGDVRAFAALPERTAAGRVRRVGRTIVSALHRSGLPVLAALDGDAYGGGCELAAACDMRIMAPHARLHWTQSRLGLTTGWGGTSSLVASVGPQTALAWLLGGRPVTATDACAAGFAQLAAHGTALESALFELEHWTAVDAATVRAVTSLVRAASAGRAVPESRAFTTAWRSRAHHDAVAAFLARSRSRDQ